LLECWRTLPACECVPDRRDFDPMAIPRLLPVISLLQRPADGEEWHFRVAGSEIERRWGRNFTGLDYLGIDIVSPRAAAAIRREFELVTEFPCGSWSQRRSDSVPAARPSSKLCACRCAGTTARSA